MLIKAHLLSLRIPATSDKGSYVNYFYKNEKTPFNVLIYSEKTKGVFNTIFSSLYHKLLPYLLY